MRIIRWKWMAVRLPSCWSPAAHWWPSSGTVDLLAALNWLIANGYEQPDMALEEIDYGWETCSTGAEDETFTMNGGCDLMTCTGARRA